MSADIPTEIPTDITTLADLTRIQAARRPDATALIFGEQRTTYGELDTLASRVAQALLVLPGFEPGARVAVVDKESAEALGLLFGVAKAQGVTLFLSWRLALPEIVGILRDAGVFALFFGSDFVSANGVGSFGATGLREAVPSLGFVLPMSDLVTWAGAAPARDPQLPVTPDDVAVMMVTSGTTGLPKGVRLAHRSFFAVVRAQRRAHGDWIGWRPEDVALFTLPNSHIGGLWWAVRGLAEGATNVGMDSFAGWKVIELVKRHRVTKFCLVPAMMQVVLSEPSMAEADFSSTESLMYGGSPCPHGLRARAMKAFGCAFYQVYGLTETGNMAVWLPPSDHLDPDHPRMASAGRPYPGVDVKVIDLEGRELPAGQTGEICLRSPAVMVDYWQRPDETARTLVDGWIRTGDAGHVDAEGYVFISDRVKDMIIYAGENVYPAEVENVLADHPAVLEVAVIGVPDDKWGELVKAVVVLRPGTDASPMELIAHARGRIAPYKLPKSVDYVEALPRTRSGKVMKHVLREPYWRGRSRKVN